jgi:hypothetical protein
MMVRTAVGGAEMRRLAGRAGPDRHEVAGHGGGGVAAVGPGAMPPGHLLDRVRMGDGELAQAGRGGAVAGDEARF